MLNGTWLVAVGLLAVLGLWWRQWRRDTPPLVRAGGSPVSLVLLLRQSSAFDPATLARQLGAAAQPPVEVTAVPFGEPLAESTFSAGSAWFVARIGAVSYECRIHDSPYFENPGHIARRVSDDRLRDAFLHHRAWISMDALVSAADSPAAYRYIARVLAGSLADNCLALSHPATRRFAVFVPDRTPSCLLAENPIDAVFGIWSPAEPDTQEPDPAENDPRLRTAEDEARHRFPEFEQLLLTRGAEGFAVRAQLESGGLTEHLWVRIVGYDGRHLHGLLTNPPRILRDLRPDAPIELTPDQVEDWIATREGELLGGFTLAARREILGRQGPRS